MVTSTTVTAIVDMPFFLLFMLVMAIIAPQLAWIAPVAVLLMILPGVLSQKKLAKLAQQNLKESTLRNAVLVESVQGLEDIKLMQAEDRFLQQWNSYIRITAQSGVEMRKVMHALISWGVTIQGLVYASMIVVGAPMVINGDITTGAIVAASLLSSRMIAPMATLCDVLACWQQVKAAKSSLDALMNLPVENSKDETRIYCPVLFGHYQFTDAMFRYYSDSLTVALRIKTLTMKQGERIAVLGRNGSGKSTLLKAMAGGMDLVGGELRLDNLSLPHIDVADVRRNVGLLTQNARLFHGTLRENLTMGAAHATDEAIFAALTVSGGADFIRRLPLGLDHPVMEGGVGLSGGQRQSLLLANGKRMLTFGGDHYVTLPLLRAHAKHFGKMALVHFDAHTDTYSNGPTFDHGTMFYTAPQEGLIDPQHSVQIGIRTEFDKSLGFNVLDAAQVNDRSVDDILAEVKRTVGDLPVYLTFDIDCLDPAHTAGTGTPVIGGLTSDKATKLIRGLQGMNIVGMDLVEVAPGYDHADLTSLAAATLALDMLHVQAANKG